MKKSSSARRGPSPGLGSDAGAEALLESRPGPGLPPSDALPRYFCTATAAQVQNRLDLPNAEGTGLFRAHEVRGITPISKVTARAYERERVVRVSEAPFRRSVKTVGLGQPRERRSLQELLKARTRPRSSRRFGERSLSLSLFFFVLCVHPPSQVIFEIRTVCL